MHRVYLGQYQLHLSMCSLHLVKWLLGNQYGAVPAAGTVRGEVGLVHGVSFPDSSTPGWYVTWSLGMRHIERPLQNTYYLSLSHSERDLTA